LAASMARDESPGRRIERAVRPLAAQGQTFMVRQSCVIAGLHSVLEPAAGQAGGDGAGTEGIDVVGVDLDLGC